MLILGISAYYHDSAAAIIQDGEIIACAQEERFTRKKQDSSFPKHAVQFCLDEAGVKLDQVEFVVFYDKPFLKFERILETYYNFAPVGFRSFIKAIPVWLKEKLYLKRIIKKELSDFSEDSSKIKLLFTEHHLSHAASAFFPSGLESAAVVTIDGVGEWATASICHAKGSSIEIVKELHFPDSIGLLYSAFTYYIGFKVNSGEYKLMGLAPYGGIDGEQTNKFIKIILDNLVTVFEDGSIKLNQKYFSYTTGLKMVPNKKWEQLFGFPIREGESEIAQVHCDLALAIQIVIEEIVLKLAKTAKKLTGEKSICIAGGVALNCVANGKLLRSKIFDNLWIQPAAGDAGGALGAALAVHYIAQGAKRKSSENDLMKGSYLGPSYSENEVLKFTRKFNPEYKHFNDFDDLAKVVAQYLDEGLVVGWHQGRMEWGPRALGNRSILGDARSPEMQKKLNLKIKYRESFRPFAPSVLEEDANDFFDVGDNSPYMLLVGPVKNERCIELPSDYYEKNLRDKLYYLRSDIPAVTHIDFSARVQTVSKKTNMRYWKLINEFKNLTGVGMVVNTSFNVRGEPIVCTPEDSYRCFMRTEMDVLVIGNFVYLKKDQPNWSEKDNWKEEFVLD